MYIIHRPWSLRWLNWISSQAVIEVVMWHSSMKQVLSAAEMEGREWSKYYMLISTLQCPAVLLGEVLNLSEAHFLNIWNEGTMITSCLLERISWDCVRYLAQDLMSGFIPAFTQSDSHYLLIRVFGAFAFNVIVDMFMLNISSCCFHFFFVLFFFLFCFLLSWVFFMIAFYLFCWFISYNSVLFQWLL